MRRRSRTVLVVTLLAVGVAFLAAFLLPESYRAGATVRVTTAAGVSGAVGFDDATYADRVLNTYRLLVGGDEFRQALAGALQVPSAPAVDASVPPNSELLELSVESRDAALAQRTANAAADVLVRQVRDQAARADAASQEALQGRLAALEAELGAARAAVAAAPRGTPEATRQADRLRADQAAYSALLLSVAQAGGANTVRASGTAVVSRAPLSDTPSGPSRALIVGLGLLCGLVAGVGLAFLLHRLDRRLYAPQAIGAAAGGDALLGTIPAVNGSHALPAVDDDAFVRIVAVLSARQPYGLRSILVAGAGSAGETWPVAQRLARSLATDGRRVVAVDGNLRRRVRGDGLAAPRSVGLSDVLGGAATLDDALLPARDGGVALLPAGSTARDPGGLLASSATRELLRELGHRFEVVVVHAAALPAIADAALLAPAVDGVVLVARAGQVTAAVVQQACDELDAVHACRLGVLVTESDAALPFAVGNGSAAG